MQKNWLSSLHIEHRVAQIIHEQAQYGWKFDTLKAKRYLYFLIERMTRIEAELRPSLPITAKQYGVTIEEPWKMDGKPKKMVTDWGLDEEVGGPFARIYYVEMNLGSDSQVKDYLLGLGWEPTFWNTRKKDTVNGKAGERTSPKIQDNGKLCPNLDELDSSLGRDIVLYLKCKHRRSLLEGLLAIVREDGRISGEANPIGAATHRMTHKKIVNIPGAEAFYGRYIRSCFVAKEGYKILGCDSKGNQIRMLCHYMNDEHYTRIVLEEDIHSENQRIAGLELRSQAKTFIYGFLFGAGDAKIGKIVKGTAKDGKRLRTRFLTGLPKLNRLVKAVKARVQKYGYIFGLDGRRIYVGSEHKALNYLLQGGEAVYMKYAQVFLYDKIQAEGLDAHYVATVHDEFQLEVKDEHVNRVRELALESMLEAGHRLNIRVPMEGDARIGRNWYETH